MKIILSSLFSILSFVLLGKSPEVPSMDTLWIYVDHQEIAWIGNMEANHTMRRVPFREIRHRVSRTPGHTGSKVICYRVRPKDNLFRISRIYLDDRVDEIRKLNHLLSANLDIGQVLKVGYLMEEAPALPAPPDFKSVLEELWADGPPEDSISTKSLRSPMDAYREQDLEIIHGKGVAYWNRSAEDYAQFFVLHAHARVNSIMEVNNPMNGRAIHAKVVGKIPPNAYTKDITLVVSPAVARHLGILDPRFYVTYKYIQ